MGKELEMRGQEIPPKVALELHYPQGFRRHRRAAGYKKEMLMGQEDISFGGCTVWLWLPGTTPSHMLAGSCGTCMSAVTSAILGEGQSGQDSSSLLTPETRASLCHHLLTWRQSSQ